MTNAQEDDGKPRTLGEAGFDIAGIKDNWPDGRQVPPLLLDVAHFVAAMPADTPGSLLFKGSRIDDYYLEDGSDLAHHFGTFLSLGSGSRVALWMNGEAAEGQEPVTLLDSEGDVRVIADTLEGFLATWALSDETHLPIEMHLTDAPLGAVAKWKPLRDFISHHLGEATLASRVGVKRAHPDVLTSFARYSDVTRAGWLKNPHLRGLAKVLDAYIPHGKPSYEGIRCLIHVIGNRLTIGSPAPAVVNNELMSAALLAQVAPLVLAERERRADPVRFGGRGLWHSASLELMGDGMVFIKADWEAEPQFGDGRATRAELDADLKRFPRTARWMQPWMSELL